ncbi:hypothetical protein [Streptomyces sp. NPDC051921]|uniref:hypothetical protein n=1 Tax=Streptomyces sp. NPDC051921 TaxID=3155806 RepID=UPI00341EFDC2
MRTALRTAVATALLAGLAITPAVAAGSAFAADGPAATAEGTTTGDFVQRNFPDGTYAKVYKLGAAAYRAEIFGKDSGIGTLETANRPAALDDAGSYFVLTNEGEMYHWRGYRVTGAKPGVYQLADGTLLELGKNPKDGRPGLQKIDRVTGKGSGFSYLYATNSVWYFGSGLVVLGADGAFAAYDPFTERQGAPVHVSAEPKPQPQPPAEIISGPTTIGECTVTEVIASSYGNGWTVTLTNDLTKGPEAVLKDGKGKALSTIDRAHPFDSVNGMKIERADTRTPRFGQHTNGGDTAPYRWNDFPKLPKDCGKKPAATPTTPATSAPQTGTQGGQTSVVPKGGVAAGAELGTVEQANDTALFASSAGAAAVVAAGLGFAAMRRRAADRA